MTLDKHGGQPLQVEVMTHTHAEVVEMHLALVVMKTQQRIHLFVRIIQPSKSV
jgi:hypothetical protein